MATGNMKDIKRRVKSVESTMQITKAMELVASSKLRKAKMKAESARPFFEAQYELMCEIAGETTDLSTIYTKKRPVKNRLFVVIAGDRGLAGGYNANVLKMAVNAHANDTIKPKIIAIGRKAAEFFEKRDYEIVAAFANVAEELKVAEAADIADIAINLYQLGEVDEVNVYYTEFISALVQNATEMPVLPVEPEMAKNRPLSKCGTTYDPSPEAVFNRVIPKFVASLLMCAVNESYASELGARRTAMENATDNAEEMISHLSLIYNRARQEKITNELNEIVAGANAL